MMRSHLTETRARQTSTIILAGLRSNPIIGTKSEAAGPEPEARRQGKKHVPLAAALKPGSQASSRPTKKFLNTNQQSSSTAQCLRNSGTGTAVPRRQKALRTAAVQPSVLMDDGSGAHPARYTAGMMAAQQAVPLSAAARAHAQALRACGTPSARVQRAVLTRTAECTSRQTFDIAHGMQPGAATPHVPASLLHGEAAVRGAQQRQARVRRSPPLGGASHAFLPDPAPHPVRAAKPHVKAPAPQPQQQLRTPRTSRRTESSVHLG